MIDAELFDNIQEIMKREKPKGVHVVVIVNPIVLVQVAPSDATNQGIPKLERPFVGQVLVNLVDAVNVEGVAL